jgi:hypothetical protein
LSKADVERLKNEPQLVDVMVFEEPTVDVTWDDEID